MLLMRIAKMKKIKLCGKIAIVKAILDAERNSLLNFNLPRNKDGISSEKLQGTWYYNFFD